MLSQNFIILLVVLALAYFFYSKYPQLDLLVITISSIAVYFILVNTIDRILGVGAEIETPVPEPTPPHPIPTQKSLAEKDRSQMIPIDYNHPDVAGNPDLDYYPTLTKTHTNGGDCAQTGECHQAKYLNKVEEGFMNPAPINPENNKVLYQNASDYNAPAMKRLCNHCTTGFCYNGTCF